MTNFLLGLIIYILGTFTGLIIPIVVYKYYSFFNLREIKSKESLAAKEETGKIEVNNLTADIISEWQTGKVVGDNDE